MTYLAALVERYGHEGTFWSDNPGLPPHPSRDGEQARETLSATELPLFNGEIRRLVAFQKAALEGVPVYEVKDPRAHLGWEDYVKVGREVIDG